MLNRVSSVALLPLLVVLGGCAELDSLAAAAAAGTGPGVDPAFLKPTVTFGGATLVRAPSQQQLAAFYCPEVADVPFGGAPILCQGFFGRRPAAADMTVAFDLRFKVSNPNRIPVPLASVLAAVTVFPAAGNQRLGATCVQVCAAGQPGCTGVAPPGACEASTRDVRSLNDFAGAAVNLIVAGGIAAAMGQPVSFTLPPVSAAAELEVVVRFAFGPEPLLATLRQLAAQSARQLQSGRAVTFDIPFRVEGTVFFDAGSVGRVAVGYGPLDGDWTLPVQGLVPL
jgi:hypothetical protein